MTKQKRKPVEEDEELTRGDVIRCEMQSIEGRYNALADELRELGGQSPVRNNKLKTPAEIMAGLNEYVVGQKNAKKVLSVSVYNHYKRLRAIDNGADVEIDKSNVMLLGPTGSGKTYLAQTLAKVLDVPFGMADATTLTEAGYVGEDVENILLKLIEAADWDLDRASRGIIYIDEIDKIGRTSGNVSITRDVSGEGVQQALLKILEGTVANVPPRGGRKHPEQQYVQFDTSNILFICGGAFVGLDQIVKKRAEGRSLGFDRTNQVEDARAVVTAKDIMSFGLIPEFVGRIPQRVTLDHLDEDALVEILTEPKNSLVSQFKEIFSQDEVGLTFEKEALKEVARQAILSDTGVRALREILEGVLMDFMFDLPSIEENVHVTLEMVRSRLAA